MQFGAPPPAPAVPLIVVGVANIDFPGEEGSVDVIFDTTAEAPLNDVGGADAGKWSVRIGEQRYGGASITAVSYNTIHIAMVNQFGESGADVIDYFDSPSDIADALGRPLGAFSDFPL
jgi:hypothetical protein